MFHLHMFFAPDFEQVKVALLDLTKTQSRPSFCEPIFITPFHLKINTTITDDN